MRLSREGSGPHAPARGHGKLCVCGGMREGCVYGKGRGSGGASCWNPTWYFCLLCPSWSFVDLDLVPAFLESASPFLSSFSPLLRIREVFLSQMVHILCCTLPLSLSLSVVSLSVFCLPQLQCAELNCCPVVVGPISHVSGCVEQE